MRWARVIWVGVALFTLVAAGVAHHFRTHIANGDRASETGAAAYLGAAACAECHASKYETYRQTSHALTSSHPDAASIRGEFVGDGAVMRTGNKDLWFEMDADSSGPRQTAVERVGSELRRRSAPIDIVVGSGRLGQSFLTWRGNELYQLPVSYSSASDVWVNTPGFKDGIASFDHPAIARCLDCHVTFMNVLPVSRDSFAKENMVLGISCERCHGPGREHAEYHRAHADVTVAEHIVKPRDLPRVRQLEICAQCHAGPGEYLQPPFTFRPGSPLEDYISLIHSDRPSGEGVHSSTQIQRLKLSRCFKVSGTMTCTTCHDPHVREPSDEALFSARCLKCHQPEDCSPVRLRPVPSAEKCTECHMPQVLDRGTKIATDSGVTSPLTRDHFISIYLPAP